MNGFEGGPIFLVRGIWWKVGGDGQESKFS